MARQSIFEYLEASYNQQRLHSSLDIKDETLRARFLAGPQIQQVLQHAQREASQVPKDHAEQMGTP